MDHYKVLGVDRNASKAEIKDAFRKLALKFHPDKHSHSRKPIRDDALLKFKQASEAYEVLIDDRKRANYNHHTFFRGGGGGGGGGAASSSYGYGYGYGYDPAARRARARTSTCSPSPGGGGGGGFHFDLTLRFLTSRTFLLNLVFASVLLGAVTVIDASGDTLWKMHNSGKSFEEAVESIEKKKENER